VLTSASKDQGRVQQRPVPEAAGEAEHEEERDDGEDELGPKRDAVVGQRDAVHRRERVVHGCRLGPVGLLMRRVRRRDGAAQARIRACGRCGVCGRRPEERRKGLISGDEL
jgi:hypothetical protein